MKRRQMIAALVLIALMLSGTVRIDHKLLLTHATVSPVPSSNYQSNSAMINEAYGKLPLSFEANEGQFDARVQFVSRSARSTLYLTSSEAVLSFADAAQAELPTLPVGTTTPDRQPLSMTESKRTTLRMKLVGGNFKARASGLDELPGKSNYFIGNDPKKWRVNVTAYSKVKYEQVYRGIDLVYYGNQRQLEYDLIVAPGADPGRIRLGFGRTNRAFIDKNGDLLIKTASGAIRLGKPLVYQNVNGVRRQVSSAYQASRDKTFRFRIGHYDATSPLVIDPQLSYSTLLGGSAGERGYSIAVDATGYAYVSGYTNSSDFPRAGALQQNLGGNIDAFVTKLNQTGTALVYSTFFGGSANEVATRIAIDAAGNAYVVGATRSANFPLMNPIQPVFGGGGDPSGFSGDAFVAKLNPSGSALVYSTYLGGSFAEFGNGIAVDSQGSVYVTGSTTSTNFPVVNAFQSTRSPTSIDAFVSKLNPAGTALIYSTYFGGSGFDSGAAIGVDPNGNAWIAGGTASRDLPTMSSLQQPFTGSNAFRSFDGGQAWASIGGSLPPDVPVNVIAVDPTNSSIVYVATSAGLFKSIDAGANWSGINSGLINGNSIKTIAIDPVSPTTLFVGNSTGIFKSTNGGNSWAINFSNPVIPNFIVALVVDPLTPSTVYAGGNNNNGVYKSTDSGETWNYSSTGLGNARPVYSMTIDTVLSSRLYLGSNDGVYRSFNGGLGWGRCLLTGNRVDVVAVDPLTPSSVYAVVSGYALAKTVDSGSNWTFINPVGISLPITALSVDPVTSSTLYAGTRQGIFKSTDSGERWWPTNEGLNSQYINALALGIQNPSTLYAGTSSSYDSFLTKFNSTGSQLLFSTYLGGSFDEAVTDIALDFSGDVHLSGWTGSSNFPIVNPLQSTLRGPTDAFVVKVASTGSSLLFSTYLGGSSADFGNGVAADAAGNTYIAGSTGSNDFPLQDPLQGTLLGSGDAFVAKLSPDGSAVLFATFLGGGFNEEARDIAIDALGNCYVTGYTDSSNFPVTPSAFQTANNGLEDVFVAKLAPVSGVYFCLQDDKNDSFLQFDSFTGDYRFSSCDGVTLTGTGYVVRKGCRLTLQATSSTSSLFAKLSTCSNSGTATIQVFSQGYTITDSDITNNTCSCPGSQPGFKR